MKLLSGYVIPISLKASADAIGKSVMFLITIVAARQLNPDPFAILALAMTTGWLLGVATDCGLSMHLAREISRVPSPARGRQLLFEVIALRSGLAFLAATLIALATPYLVPGHWQIQFLVIVIAQLAGAVIETVAHYFRGIQRTGIEAAIHAVQRLVTLAWALVVLFGWRRLDYLGVALLVPALAAMVTSMWVAARISASEATATTVYQPVLTPSSFFRDVFPLGAGVLISALYFRIDVYFIQQWHGFQPVGGYNAAFRLIEALRLLPAAVMAVTFPMLVRASDTADLRKIAAPLTAAGVAMAIVCAGGGSWIIPAVYGEGYAYAAPAFSILALALPLFFLNYALTHQVIGWDGHRAYLAIVTLALIGNIAANIALIPTLGIAGAAIATVVTEIIVTVGCVTTIVRHEGSARRCCSPRGFGTEVRHEGSPRGFVAMSPSRDQELAVLKSVLYASLFDYPLTPAQLEATLIGVKADAATIESWWRGSELLQTTIELRDGLYFPAGRCDLVQTRLRREAVSRDLLERDRRIIALVSKMPFVRMVALSGSLAHLNAEGSADLDLFVITAPNRVWSVTVATLVIARLLGCRKRVCMNYVISERAMRVEPQDLFSANQIIHLQPIVGGNVFARFVDENDFVSRLYPNFQLPRTPAPAKASTFAKATVDKTADEHAPLTPLSERMLSLGPAQIAEQVARALYGWHLRRRSSTWHSRDQVRLDAECLKLHTSSHRDATMRRFDAAIAAAVERPLNVLV